MYCVSNSIRRPSLVVMLKGFTVNLLLQGQSAHIDPTGRATTKLLMVVPLLVTVDCVYTGIGMCVPVAGLKGRPCAKIRKSSPLKKVVVIIVISNEKLMRLLKDIELEASIHLCCLYRKCTNFRIQTLKPPHFFVLEVFLTR
jgi:hypothetical protein